MRATAAKPSQMRLVSYNKVKKFKSIYKAIQLYAVKVYFRSESHSIYITVHKANSFCDSHFVTIYGCKASLLSHCTKILFTCIIIYILYTSTCIHRIYISTYTYIRRVYVHAHVRVCV